MPRHRADDSSTDRELLRALLEEQQLNRELIGLMLAELRIISRLLDTRYNAPVSGTITVRKAP